MGTPQSLFESLTGSAAAMASLVLILLLPFMAAAAPKNQERGLLGDLITGPVDLAQCMGKCPINPLEFAKCSAECAKGPEEKNRGLMADLAVCAVQCKLTPDGTCKNGPLGLPKPCSLINLATDFATG